MQQVETLGIEELIHRWGGSISEAVLDASCQFFSTPEIEGFIGYHLENGCAVILGEPVCAEENKTLIALAFQKYCIENGLSSIYFIVSKKFAQWAIAHTCKIMIEIGEEIIFDPFFNPAEGHKGARLRNRIHHAEHMGLSIQEYLDNDPKIEKAIMEVGKNWLNARQGPQIYLGNLNFFKNRSSRRWFYLEDGNKNIIGMSLLSQLEAHQGWLLKFLIVTPEAPRGSSELLMMSILDTLQNENCHYLTYGMIPAEHLGEIIGLNTITAGIAKISFKMAKWFFHLDQRKTYWKKFHPKEENSFLLFSSPKIGLKELRALASTMKIDF